LYVKLELRRVIEELAAAPPGRIRLNPHWPNDIPDLLLAHIFESHVDLALHILVHAT
jgi:hypothetical protein